MSHELARRAVSIAHLRRRKTSLADEAIARARREAEQLREQLMEAEAEGREGGGWGWIYRLRYVYYIYIIYYIYILYNIWCEYE
jgi:hypothetical protein